MPSLQDFSLIRSYVEKFSDDFNLKNQSDGFLHFILSLTLGLQEDEVTDSITDNNYLISNGGKGGHDRGIDAVYIDETDAKQTIHFFNCKYTEQFQKTNNHFPSNETDKIIGFLNDLMAQDPDIKQTVNPLLYSKVEEIWDIFDKTNPNFVIHICANYYNGFEKKEGERFERAINKHNNFNIEYHLMDELVARLTRKDRQSINARMPAVDVNYFKKTHGDINALIVEVDAIDLIRIVLNNQDIRNQTDIADFKELKKYEILEEAFEENVRVYLKQRSKINRSIKATALSEDNYKFFYFNNGITITCDKFSYPERRSPIIELENLQIVNGSQTIHALYDALEDDSGNFNKIQVLCRIYETKNTELSQQIAEYTNSQNPVKRRDIRSIDFMQQKLERELESKGYYYERKKGQHADKPKRFRLDAEKIGQVLLSFYQEMPSEAKNKKSLIFAEKYDDIFSDDLTADKVLLAYKLFEHIENKKKIARNQFLAQPEKFDEESFIIYASYYLIYIIGQLAKQVNLELELNNLSELEKLYPKAVEIVQMLIKTEQENLKGHKDKYTHALFFKSTKPKKLFEQYIESNT